MIFFACGATGAEAARAAFMSVPGTLPPKTAKPLKRKRAEKFSQAGDDDDVATTPAGFLAAPVAAPAADGKHPVAPADYDHDDDDFSDSEYKSIYEDALDEIELNPYHPGGFPPLRGSWMTLSLIGRRPG